MFQHVSVCTSETSGFAGRSQSVGITNVHAVSSSFLDQRHGFEGKRKFSHAVRFFKRFFFSMFPSQSGVSFTVGFCFLGVDKNPKLVGTSRKGT